MNSSWHPSCRFLHHSTQWECLAASAASCWEHSHTVNHPCASPHDLCRRCQAVRKHTANTTLTWKLWGVPQTFSDFFLWWLKVKAWLKLLWLRKDMSKLTGVPDTVFDIGFLRLHALRVQSLQPVAQPGFDLGEGTAVMDPEIWNRGGSHSPALSPLPLEWPLLALYPSL